MNKLKIDLENLFVLNLQSTNKLKNELENKENEKHDQLKDISLGIIDILDSFERVEEWLIEKGLDKSEDSVKTKKRYGSMKSKLLNLLLKYQITKMEFPNGRLIVGWCEVVDKEPDSNRKNDEIISIVRNGYVRFKKDVIRAAQIIVVKN